MGSSGSGRISDYPGSSPQTKPQGSNGENGGGTPQDRCARAFTVDLEDVESSDYFKKNNALPPVGTRLQIVQKKRLVAETLAGESVGNIPTSHNYLAACMKEGWIYVGEIRSSVMRKPEALVSADFAATAPK